MRLLLLYNSTEKNKFEESRAAVSTEDVNNGEIETEDSISGKAATENNDDCTEKIDDTKTTKVETSE